MMKLIVAPPASSLLQTKLLVRKLPLGNLQLGSPEKVPGDLLVVPENTLPQNHEYLEEAVMEGEKEEEREKGRRRRN